MAKPAITPVRTYTVSLGCPKNRVDTERLLGALGSNMIPADSVNNADLV
ncbi:MAG TPA: 30S ribosomal protein S12 methylthiotransferase RimO, partial [Pseudodesulfovibrio sp.]|nr:30S ribosomal protein S12 methylthiotransferase RimO [Pseudodesulfovibrio sp.]